jgi:hypothetical protein
VIARIVSALVLGVLSFWLGETVGEIVERRDKEAAEKNVR